MARPETLAKREKEIIEANIDKFPSQIQRIPEIARNPGITRSIIKAYQKEFLSRAEPSEALHLADLLDAYIRNHGLPACYHGKQNVTGFIEYLKRE
jgi:hypothetical protein